MLKNKKFMGKIQEQFIRVKSKPLIAEVGDSSKTNNINTKKIDENTDNKRRFEIPKYRIVKEPETGDVQYLVAEIELPSIVNFIF
jgi:hypothetical protein